MNYVADFETHVPNQVLIDRLDRKKYPKNYLKKEDLKTWVWGYGFCKVGDVEDSKIKIGSNIDDFMKDIMKLKNPKIYFHNLKFDGHFILSWAFKNGYKFDEDGTKESKTINVLISNMNAFYSIELIHKKRNKGYVKTTFYDSLKKLPFSVEKIGKAFDLEYNKIEVDEEFYLRHRGENHVLTEEEKMYIRNDVRVMSQALQIQFNQGLTKMTTGSDALSDYKETVGKAFETWFPILDLELNTMVLSAYRGGWTYASDKYKEKNIKNGLVYDVNSLYPSVMYYEKMPYGMPLFYNGKYEEDKEFDLFIQEFSCEFKLKKDRLPTIQVKGQSHRYPSTEYLKESLGETTLYLTNVDLDLFFEQYDVWNIDWKCGLKFRSKNDMFKDYIEKWTLVKENSTGAIRELSKLMLNSLYGKFGTKPNVTGKTVYFEDNLVKLKLGEEEMRDPIYTAVAVFTTSYGRDKTIRTAQQNYENFAYADTDSVHIVGNKVVGIETHKTKMGKWSLDGKFRWAKFIGAKCYAEDIWNSKKKKWELKITVAGMPKNMHKYVTKENFNVGLTLSGKKMPVVIDGGVILVDRNYEMKIRNFGGY